MDGLFSPATSVADCVSAVVAETHISLAQLRGERRGRETARPRQVAYLLAAELTVASYPMIARELHRDHSTVLYGVRRARVLLQQSPEFARLYRVCRDSLLAKVAGGRGAV